MKVRVVYVMILDTNNLHVTIINLQLGRTKLWQSEIHCKFAVEREYHIYIYIYLFVYYTHMI